MTRFPIEPRIALVSSMRPSGGRRYAETLADALGAEVMDAQLPIFRLWSHVRRGHFDIVDIQFEYSTFGSHLASVAKLPVLAALLRLGSTGVVTLHGVVTRSSLEGETFGRLKWFTYFASVKLASFFSQLLVHSISMRDSLQNYGIRAEVVPHGSKGGAGPARGGRSVNDVLFFGFIRPSKGLSNLIEAMGSVRESRPEAKLVIAGSVRNASEANHLKVLKAKVGEEKLSDTVYMLTGYLSDAQMAAAASRSSILVLPYTDTFEEVSGVVHDLACYGVALVCSDTPRFSELRGGVECLKTGTDPREIAEAIVRVMKDDRLRQDLAKNLEAFARATSWESVAKMRMEAYLRLLSS